VIRVERCDFPFRVLEELFRHNAIRISEFEKDAVAGWQGRLSVLIR
jgi:hypothetical protein